MLEAHRRFMAGMRTLHPVWQLWVMILMLVNGIAPFFFLPDFVAIMMIAGTFSGAALGMVLVSATGFSKLLGLMHMPWVPMLVAQLWLYPGFDPASRYSLWLTAAIAVTMISLMIDAVDVRAWFRQRAEEGCG